MPEHKNPLETRQAQELDEATTAPNVVYGVDGDIAVSLRPGEDGSEIAASIDGLEYLDTRAFDMHGQTARLGQFNITE